MSNKTFKSIISIILVISILFSSSYIFSVYAESKQGYITNDDVKVRKTPTTLEDNEIKVNDLNLLLDTNHKVTILETVDSNGDDINQLKNNWKNYAEAVVRPVDIEILPEASRPDIKHRPPVIPYGIKRKAIPARRTHRLDHIISVEGGKSVC